MLRLLIVGALCLGAGLMWAMGSSDTLVIPADTIDIGGGYAASLSYGLHGAVGGNWQTGTLVSSDHEVCGGYLYQTQYTFADYTPLPTPTPTRTPTPTPTPTSTPFDTGWRYPSANTLCGEEYPWGYPQNVYAEDSVYAYGDDYSHVTYGNYNISIPAGSTIKGIQVGVKGYRNDPEHPGVVYCKLGWNGCASWTVAKSSVLPQSNNWVYLGSPTDTWGRTWSAADFNNPRFVTHFTEDIPEIHVDAIKIKVHYTLPVYSASGDFSSTQGYLQWYYQKYQNGAYSDLVWSTEKNRWQTSPWGWTPPTIWSIGSEPAFMVEAARKWVAPHCGKVTITGNARKVVAGGDGVVASIIKNGTLLWQQTIGGGNTTGFDFNLSNVGVNKDDAIYFRVSNIYDDGYDSIYFDPTITYTMVDTGNDTDGDGLTDDDEINVYHTDPFNADTDGDGLSDGKEVKDYKTDPLDSDTDNDGYSDGYEVNLGRNPLDPNSHPGETSLLVINEVLYDHPGNDGGHEFVELYNNQGTAVDLGGYRIQASVKGRFETTCVIPRGKVIGPYSYFLVGESLVRDINQKMPDAVVTLELQNGDQNDPDAPNQGRPSCTDGVRLVRPNGYVVDTVLYDYPNTTLYGDASIPGDWDELNQDVTPGQSLSRKVAGVDSNNAYDFEALSSPSPTGSGVPDSDNDGLNNVAEASYGTNPLDADSDDDGWVDGSEVGAHTNPLSASSKPKVVINEVYYDPAGADDQLRREFVELYNDTNYPVDISALRIEYGGAWFGDGFVQMPLGAVIGAHSYYLVGDINVQSYFGVAPDLVRGLALQNGDKNDDAVPYPGKPSPTDGVRLVGWGKKVFDTVLYDTPNDSKLSGDASNPAGPGELNPDVQPGHSLSRKAPGVDTNNIVDWEERVSPSPGNP